MALKHYHCYYQKMRFMPTSSFTPRFLCFIIKLKICLSVYKKA